MLRHISVILGLPFFFPAPFAIAQISVTMANYGSSRLNANVSETILTRAAVSGGPFGKIGMFPVDGQVYAQPLYVAALPMPGQGTKNVVFVATMNNSVYAIDADSPGDTIPLWQVSLGPAAPSAAIPYVNDLSPQIGILSTPVIDPDAQVIYAVAETFEAGAPVFRLHGLSLLTGQETQNGPAVISASVAGTGGGSVKGVIQFDPFWHIQRPGLALANGNVYVAFGSHSDAGSFHGWVVAYNAANLQHQTAVFNATPNGKGGGIWQSGRGLAVDDSGNVLVVTGNGDFDGMTDLSGAVIKLSGTDLSVLDWYTPAAWKYLNANDLDVGSVGALTLPGTGLILTGDKGGRLINLKPDALGHVETAPGTDGFLVSPAGVFNLALWQTDQGPVLYEHDLGGVLKAFSVTSAGITRTPAFMGTWEGDSLYQGLAISANGSADGILWETTGDHSQPGIPAILHAWNASDLTQELWNSNMNPDDRLGSFAKFATPLVVNGRVYAPTLSNQLVIYGLKTSVANSNAPQVDAVLNTGSLLQTPLSPGELVSIFGSNLGPSEGASFQLDGSGKVPSLLGATQVTFDGIPAPVLYSSSGEITVSVPFEVTTPGAEMIVSTQAGRSAPLELPVVPAAPAIFTMSGLGTGQIAALNQDGSLNSSTNPAGIDSVVSVFATGLGQTSPPGMDGAVSTGVLGTPILPVSVEVGGWPAYVLYAGPAPGSIQGVSQINFRIPPLAPAGNYIMVVLRAGAAASQADVWIDIAQQ